MVQNTSHFLNCFNCEKIIHYYVFKCVLKKKYTLSITIYNYDCMQIDYIDYQLWPPFWLYDHQVCVLATHSVFNQMVN